MIARMNSVITPDAKVILNHFVDDIKDFYRAGSVFHIADSDRFDRDHKKILFRNHTERVEKGIRQAIKGAARKFSLLWAMGAVLSLLPFVPAGSVVRGPTTMLPLVNPGFFSTVIVAPVVEELVFRGGVQNGIDKAQKWAKRHFSVASQKTPWFRMLTSRAARVIGTNIPFALANLAVAPLSLSSITQVALMFLYPTYSILYETTNDLRFPIGAHIANNGASWLSNTFKS